MMILNLSETLAKPLVMAKLNMAYLSSLKNQQNCCRPTCRCHHLGYSVPPALHRTIWCRSTFGPRGPGLNGLNGLNKKSKFLQGPVSPNFCARRSVMMILNLSETLAKPLVMAKLNMAFVKFKKPAKLLSSYLPVSPSRVLRAPGTSPYHLVPKHLRTTWSRP